MLSYAYLLKKKLIDFLKDMNDPRKDILIQIYKDNKDLFYYAKGSSKKHHVWKQGYIDHVTEMFRIIIMFYQTMNNLRTTNFTEDSAKIIAFIHDWEKIIRYGPQDHPKVQYWNKLKGTRSWYEMRDIILKEELYDKYNLALTPEERNALQYVHGEGDDHNPDMRVATPLAFFCNICDSASAGIWQNEGKGLG